ncbi:unnamed protein product [Lactuca saligna]|uniref:Raptor N-terminal CASPase-like domain-containing protein n=1 Tax=Lactuca saligna TaxID=75948 RepID=A0AA35ZIZ3_LACSI|nr:unnamed protein product [Lactuca saligna]
MLLTLEEKDPRRIFEGEAFMRRMNSVDPPDVINISPCARMKCWIDPFSMAPQKALETIGKTLSFQYERWKPKAKYKIQLAPTVEEVKKLYTTCRKYAKSERVLFHYNGHGVPKPTANGEIWFFNRYIPLPISDLDSWLKTPSIYVFDCSVAGVIANAFIEGMFDDLSSSECVLDLIFFIIVFLGNFKQTKVLTRVFQDKMKVFPNMLPFTLQDTMKKQEALKRKLNARIKYAKFLQDTVKEMAKEIQNNKSGEVKKTTEDLDEFLSVWDSFINQIFRPVYMGNGPMATKKVPFYSNVVLGYIVRENLLITIYN